MAEVNVTPDVVEHDTPEYVAEMTEKVDGKEQPAERPAWLPEGFDTPEQLAAAWQERDAPVDEQNPEDLNPEDYELADEEAPEGEEEAPEGDEETPDEEAAEEAVEAAGLDMADLEARFVENGQLDDADYAALEAVGISANMVDAYIAGQQALGAQVQSRMVEAVGGEEAFGAISEWAGENLTQDEVDAFNDTIERGSESAILMALQGLQARYERAGNRSPKLLHGRNAPTSSDAAFRSNAELTQAMRDPRYARDEAYRADVARRLENSSLF